MAILPGPLGAFEWHPTGPPGNPIITAMATAVPDHFTPSPAVLFAAAAGAGVLRSDDLGNTWTPTGPGLEGHNPVALAVKQVQLPIAVDFISYSNTVLAATFDAGVFRLLPDATSWAPANGGLASLDVRSLTVDAAGVVYAGTAGGLFASTDAGGSWSPKGAGLPSGADGTVSALAVDPDTGTLLYAGTGTGLFKSGDGGQTWSKCDTGSTLILSVSAVSVDPLEPSRVYVAGFKTFACSPLCLPIAFQPVALRSLDGGASWLPMDGLTGDFVRTFAATTTLPRGVFAGTTGSSVFFSPDGGATWQPSGNALPAGGVSSLVIDPLLPSFIYAGTVQGVFYALLGQVAEACSPQFSLCMNDRRFSANIHFRDSGDNLTNGQPLAITDKTGAFWFFDPTNLDLVVKVLDGRSINGKWWVFYGSLTNVEFSLTVTDTMTGAVRTYFNPQGQMASVADTSAF